MNENKRINDPWIRVLKCVDTLKMKTFVESLQKQTVGLIFNIKKNHSNWIGPYRQKKIFQVHGPWQIFQSLIFVCVKIVVK